jgi:predicted phage tail component-like protein
MIYGATFKGLHSYTAFKLTMISDNRTVLSDVVRYTKFIPGYGSIDFGNDTYNEKPLNVTFTYCASSLEDLQTQMEQIGGWLYNDGAYHDLIFDDAPLRKYKAKVTSKVNLKQGDLIGELSVEFTCNPPYPYALDNSPVSPADVAGRLLWDTALIDTSPVPVAVTLKNSKSAYTIGTSDTNTTPISFVDNSALQLAFNGKTLTNAITNGNFATSSGNLATGFSVNTANAVSCTGNTQTFIATAASGYLYQNSTVLGHRYFIVANVKATSSNVKLQINNGVSTDIATHPGDNLYHTLSFVTTLTVTHSPLVIDTSASVWANISVQNFMAIDMGTSSANPLYNLTANQMQNLINGYIDGTKSIVNPQFVSKKSDGTVGSTLSITGTIISTDRFTWDGAVGKINSSAVTTSGNLIAYQNGNIFVQNSDGTVATVVPVSELTYYQGMTIRIDGTQYLQDLSANGTMKFTVGGAHSVKPIIKLIGNIASGLTLTYGAYSWKYNAALLFDGIIIDCVAQTVTRISDGANLYPYVDATYDDYFNLAIGQQSIGIAGVAGAYPNDLTIAIEFTPIF